MTPVSPRATDRQEQVIRLLGEGHGTREIADCLGLSEHTVKRHRENGIRALGARNQTNAVMLLVRLRDGAVA